MIELYLRQGNYATINNRIYQRYVTEGEKAAVYLSEEDLSREGMFQISASFRGHVTFSGRDSSWPPQYSNWADVELSALSGHKLVIYEDENKKIACRIEELTDEERAQLVASAPAKPENTPKYTTEIPPNGFRLVNQAYSDFSMCEVYLTQDDYGTTDNRLNAHLSYNGETVIVLTDKDLERGGSFQLIAYFKQRPDISIYEYDKTTESYIRRTNTSKSTNWFDVDLETLIGHTLIIKNDKYHTSIVFEIE